MSKSIFEEVGGKDEAPATVPGGAEATRERDRSRIRWWLIVIALMVVIQIVVGGLTRVTDSGLSITEWRPVTGMIPPLSEEAWRGELEKYRSTTEYQLQNKGMSLEDFKVIYYWEWGHRLWGMLIGFAFVIPFAFFYLTKAIPTGWTTRIAIVGGLGLLQGVIGWWMVQSGLVGRLDVSQYRLATHLGLAFAILALLEWHVLSLGRPDWALLQARRRREEPIRLAAYGLVGVCFLQVIMGAFVSGMDAGGSFPEWPTMEGGFYPSDTPFNPFEEPGAAHFAHRMLGYGVALAAAFFFWRTMSSGSAKTRLWGKIALGIVLFQIVLGIITVLNGAPASWAVIHQFGAILVFGGLVHAAHQSAFPKEEALAAQ